MRTLVYILLAIALSVSTRVFAQHPWEVGGKGGYAFYLGDYNRTFFRPYGMGGGVYARYNWNAHFATKVQALVIDIKKPISNTVVDVDAQQEFNFFPFGQMNSLLWSRRFSPYISLGMGVNTFQDRRKSTLFAFNMPFSFGLKVKLKDRINLGLEWTMHKLFTDDFDGSNNPYDYQKRSPWMGKDWFSLCAINLGVDIGEKGRFCK